MKNIIFVAASVILFIAFALINMSSVLYLGIGNFIVSLIFIAFWGIMVKFTAEGRGMMIYSISFWSAILVSSLISLVSAAMKVSVGFLMVPVAFLTAPLFGIRALIASSIASYIVLLFISATFVAGSSYFLIRKSM